MLNDQPYAPRSLTRPAGSPEGPDSAPQRWETTLRLLCWRAALFLSTRRQSEIFLDEGETCRLTDEWRIQQRREGPALLRSKPGPETVAILTRSQKRHQRDTHTGSG